MKKHANLQRRWQNICNAVIVAALLIFFLPVTACVSSQKGGAGEKDEVELTILFTNDLHSSGDYARLATLIKEQRALACEEGLPLLLVDAGDMAMGSIFQTLFPTHAFEYVAMAQMGYDACTFGNHDFDFGLNALENMFEAGTRKVAGMGMEAPPFIVSNLGMDVSGYPLLSQVKDTLTISRSYISNGITKNIKIGLFGLMGKEAFSTIVSKEPLHYEKGIVAAERAVAALKSASADYIVALSHSGTLEDKRLASKVDGIDLIISGHDHDTLHDPIIINETAIVSSGAMNRYLGRIVIGKGGILSYRLLPLSSSIQADPQMEAWVEENRHIVSDKFKSISGLSLDDTLYNLENSFDLNILPDGSLPLASHIARSYSRMARRVSDLPLEDLVAIIPYGVIRAPLDSGAVTLHDIYDVLSLGISADGAPGYPLVMAWVTGNELEDICELNATVAGRMRDARLFFDGLSFTYNKRAMPFFRVKEVMVNGAKIKGDSLYPVVTGLYTAQLMGMLSSSSFGILSVVPKDSKGNPIEDLNRFLLLSSEWMAFAEYVKEKGLDTPL